MRKVASYKPSLWRASKYRLYFNYFTSYVKAGDYQSLFASIRYMCFGRLPARDFIAESAMGRFRIRKGTTDFQFINPAYELKVKEYIIKNLPSFDVFIDVGACIGEYSIWLAGLGKKCIAIEPINYLAMVRNIRLNGLDECIMTFDCGLSNKQEYAGFVVPEGLPAASHRDLSVFPSDENSNQVWMMTLDEVLDEIGLQEGLRYLVKLDVEGMEPEVIEGAREFIRNNEVIFIYEHFPEDRLRNDKVLTRMADFRFTDIDAMNRLAEKC